MSKKRIVHKFSYTQIVHNFDLYNVDIPNQYDFEYEARHSLFHWAAQHKLKVVKVSPFSTSVNWNAVDRNTTIHLECFVTYEPKGW